MARTAVTGNGVLFSLFNIRDYVPERSGREARELQEISRTRRGTSMFIHGVPDPVCDAGDVFPTCRMRQGKRVERGAIVHLQTEFHVVSRTGGNSGALLPAEHHWETTRFYYGYTDPDNGRIVHEFFRELASIEEKTGTRDGIYLVADKKNDWPIVLDTRNAPATETSGGPGR